MTEEQRQKTRRIRKKLHEALPSCIAVVDHGDYVGAYFYPEDLDDAEKVVKTSDWEGATVQVRPMPRVNDR